MRQILFHIPILNIPIYGYGAMLFLAFIFCSWLARRLCKREGIDGTMIPDLAIWLFIAGIAGGRTVYVIQYWHLEAFDRRPWWDVVKLWDGGLVLYGALFGGLAGYFAFYQRHLKEKGVSHWKMLDIIAPCVALGVMFGRMGCLMTGCCYGNVACESCLAIHFPVYANTSPPKGNRTAPADQMIRRGYQTPNGFLLNPGSYQIEGVEPGSPAADAGLKAGDLLLELNGKEPREPKDFYPNEDGVLNLTVERDGKNVELPAFRPVSIGLNPTQIFESISMCLLLFFLLSFYPFKRRDGEVMVLLLMVYSVHRYLNEMLRTDTDPVLFGLTLSQNISIGIFVVGAILAVIVWRRPLISATLPVVPEVPKEPGLETGIKPVLEVPKESELETGIERGKTPSS